VLALGGREDQRAVEQGLDDETSLLIRYGGWQTDIPSLRPLDPGLMNFEAWLASGGSALIDDRLVRAK
jgi:hypothetical protein